jgi:hypothetical protein
VSFCGAEREPIPASAFAQNAAKGITWWLSPTTRYTTLPRL